MFTLRPLSWFGFVVVLALTAARKSRRNYVPDDECDDGPEDVPWLPED
jgi:hypothetical protein